MKYVEKMRIFFFKVKNILEVQSGEEKKKKCKNEPEDYG